MKTNALLGIAAAVAGIAFLAWPAPREDKPRDAIQIVHGGLPPPPAGGAWMQPGEGMGSVQGSSRGSGPYPLAHYAWEAREAADDDAPGDPGIWATPAEFAAPE